MDIFSQSEQLRQALTPFIQKIVDERTKECLRTYKAKIVNEPNTTTKKCGVQLVGQENILSLPYSEDCRGVSVGDMVWVATTYGSWKNAVVFSKVGFGKSLPKGFVYITLDPTPPDILFGGTWEKIEGKFLLSASSEYTAGSTGGSADAVVVSHHHTGLYYNAISKDRELSADTANGQQVSSGGHIIRTSNVQGTNRYVTGEVGVDGTGKNMPPYLAVYMWKRIA